MMRRLRGFVDYLRVFSSVGDIRRFRRIAYGGGTDPVDVCVRQAGKRPMRIRPHTSDAAVLWDTFHEQFHLPPMKLRNKAVILDLGANVGYTSAHFAHLYPGATVVAVELDRNNCAAAAVNLRSFPNCRLVNAAAWCEDGLVSYNPADEAWAFHITDGGCVSTTVTATAKTIATLMRENGLTTIDYVKMDIEGAEWPVLSAGAEWLTKVAALKIELHSKFNANATFENCAHLLSAQGFQCTKDDRHWDTLVAVRY